MSMVASKVIKALENFLHSTIAIKTRTKFEIYFELFSADLKTYFWQHLSILKRFCSLLKRFDSFAALLDWICGFKNFQIFGRISGFLERPFGKCKRHSHTLHLLHSSTFLALSTSRSTNRDKDHYVMQLI